MSLNDNDNQLGWHDSYDGYSNVPPPPPEPEENSEQPASSRSADLVKLGAAAVGGAVVALTAPTIVLVGGAVAAGAYAAKSDKVGKMFTDAKKSIVKNMSKLPFNRK